MRMETQTDAAIEFRRIRERIHTVSLSQDAELLSNIEDFGKMFGRGDEYKALRRKYWWHRKIHPRHIPIGVAPEGWIEQQTPLVSVIIPSYGHAPYLAERIDSILNQTFQNFELIILDDCSPDDSREIIMKYEDNPHVSHILFNEENTGNTFLQWEKGVSLAKGKYIWIAESDDYADETFLDSAMTMFFFHEDCVMVRTGSYQVNEKGRVLLRDWDLWKEDETIHYYHGEKYIRHNMLHFNYIYNASMVVFRKDAFLKIDKSYSHLRYAGDWQCWIEMLLQGNICEYRRKLNYFRQHSNKVSKRSNSTNKGIFDQIRVLAYALKHIKVSSFRRMMIRGEQYKFCLRWFYGEKDSALREDCFRVLRDELRASKWDYRLYRFVLAFDFLPFIPTQKRDKYK